MMVRLRRGKLRLVNPVNKKQSLHNFRAKYAKSLDKNIAYQTLPSVENKSTNIQTKPQADIISHKPKGPPIAYPDLAVPQKFNSDEPVNVISNAALLDIPDAKDVPTKHEFEIMRLRRRILELDAVVRDKDARIVRAIGALEDELQLWRTYLHDHVGETMGSLLRRVIRLESTADYLRDKGAHVAPSLDIPSKWAKTER